MLLVGLALPYRVALVDEAWADAQRATTTRPNQRVMFAHGCCTHAIDDGQYVEIVVNHQWKEHLASTKHGLSLFENFNGLYFRADLPATPYAKSIYDAVVAGKIQHVCTVSKDTNAERIGDDVVVVRRANITALSLLVTSPPHSDHSWVSWSGPQAEARIQREATLAERRHLWALDPSLSADDVAARIAKLTGA